MTKAPVTLTAVALKAGVSVGTVSRALRGIGKVSPAKADNIKRIASQLGYAGSALSDAVAAKRVTTVAVLVPAHSNPHYGASLDALEAYFRPRGILLLAVQAPAAADGRRELLLALAAKKVAGFLVLAAEDGDAMLD